MTWTCHNRPLTGAPMCEYENSDANAGCLKCGAARPADRPAGLSEEERAALDAFNIGRRAIGGSDWSVESWISGDATRPEAVAFYRAARAPLEAENAKLRAAIRDLEHQRDGHMHASGAAAERAERLLERVRELEGDTGTTYERPQCTCYVHRAPGLASVIQTRQWCQVHCPNPTVEGGKREP